MSCSLRDAASLEARGVPTIVYVNDVFRPIAQATAALLAMPREHLDITVIYLPHPTSMLARDAVTALIDARADALFDAAAGRISDSVRERVPVGARTHVHADAAEAARSALAALASSLRDDGGELRVDGDETALHVRLEIIDGAECADGSCLLPPASLRAMVESLLAAAVPRARIIYDDARGEVATG